MSDSRRECAEVKLEAKTDFTSLELTHFHTLARAYRSPVGPLFRGLQEALHCFKLLLLSYSPLSSTTLQQQQPSIQDTTKLVSETHSPASKQQPRHRRPLLQPAKKADRLQRATMSYPHFYKDDEYSDITIKFSGREVPCHKMVICTQSEYFKKLCGKGSQFAESKQKVVELKDDDPDAVDAIIRQLYFGTYSGANRNSEWSFHAEVAITAKKVRSSPRSSCFSLISSCFSLIYV